MGTPPVVIGTKDFAEQFLLGELYAQALRAKGYTVMLQQNIGGSEIIDSAFASNQIQMYPEYLGEIASGLAQQPAAATPLETYQQAQQFERSARAATVLAQTPFQDTDVVVVRRDFAARYGLRSVGDLAALGPGGAGVVIAAQPPFRTRASGLAGMATVYGLTGVQLLAVSPDETYQAMNAGQAQAADAFSTDAELGSGQYTALDDPQNIFGFQYVAPVVKQATLDAAGPAFAQTCNWVSSLLTIDDIRAMNQQVQLGGADEASVARDFLLRHGLR
jgi:osmoprotectant transport system substrate-binding protein